MTKIKKNKIPRIKKDIQDFLIAEEGTISKKSVIDTGLALALLTVFLGSQTQEASGQYPHTSGGTHTSLGGDPAETCHNQHSNHGSHGSHASHSNGGCSPASW